MAKKENYSIYLLAIVAIVAVVGIVIMVNGGSSGVSDSAAVNVVDEEGNLAGEAFRKSIKAFPKVNVPNLKIRSVYFESADVYLYVRANIQNTGNSNVNVPFHIKFITLSSDGSEWESVTSDEIQGIKVGETKIITLGGNEYDYNLLKEEGIISFEMKIDSLNQVTESSEADNTYKNEFIAKQELVILSAKSKIVSQKDNVANILLKIKNSGSEDITESFYIKVACTESGTLYYGNTDITGPMILVDSIKSGETKTISKKITYEKECNNGDTFDYQVFIDPDDTLDELSRHNNQKYGHVDFP